MLACGYSEGARAKELMVTLQAFVDDSASEVGDKRLFLAALINGADHWTAFSDAWGRELAAHPKISYFKMSQAESLRGEFRGWSREARDKKVMALARLVEEHGCWAVYCSVSRAEYAQILAPIAPQPLKNPYFSCFWGVIDATARYHHSIAPNAPPVDFIFDEQGGLGDEAVNWYRWLKEGRDPATRALLGATPIFRDDKSVVALQAADMLAWHIRRDYERQGAEDRPALDLLLKFGGGIHLPATALALWAKQMSRVPGVKLIQDKASWRNAKRDLQAKVARGDGPPSINPVWMHIRYLVFRLRRLMARWRRSRNA